MCIDRRPIHPRCNHAAEGTAAADNVVTTCDDFDANGSCTQKVKGTYVVERKYCDDCIIEAGIESQGLGEVAGKQCFRMGVELEALKWEHPGRLPK